MSMVALSLLLATGAAVQNTPVASDAVKSADFAVVLIELTGRSEYKGVPLICPGDTEPTKPDDICLSAVYDVPIDRVRRIAGPRSIRGRRLRYKIIESGLPEGMTILAAVVRTDDAPGLYAPWWKMPDERGDICLSREDAESLKIVPQWSRWNARVIGVHYPVRCLST